MKRSVHMLQNAETDQIDIISQMNGVGIKWGRY